MSVYSKCGILGLFPQRATREDFEDRNYQPASFYTSCGILGFGKKEATLDQIPNVWKQNCNPSTHSNADGDYAVTSAGVCSLAECHGGYFKVQGRCVPPGTACTPDVATKGGSYTYDATGSCSVSSCSVGKVLRPEFMVARTGSTRCPTGYEPMTNKLQCKAAVQKFGIAEHSPFETKEVAVMDGCAVYENKGKTTSSYNENPKGSGIAPKDQFIICKRTEQEECIRKGDACKPGHKNYHWDASGRCVGKCSSAPCANGEKCCAKAGKCIPDGTKCPVEQDFNEDATQIADVLKTFTGSLSEVSRL